MSCCKSCKSRSSATAIGLRGAFGAGSAKGACCPLPSARGPSRSGGCGCGKCSGTPTVASPASHCCPGDAAAQAALRCCEMRLATNTTIAASTQNRLQTNNRLLKEQVTLLRASLMQSQAAAAM